MRMKQTTKRKLAMESLEDRKLMTVMTEFAEIGRLDQIASEYGAEPAAEVAAEKQVSSRLDLHNNGAFRSPGGHIIWNVADDSETNTGTLEEIAKSQKNDAAYIKFDGIMGASKTPNPHVAIDQLFSLVGEGERSFMAKDLWG